MRRFLFDFMAILRTCAYCGSFYSKETVCEFCWAELPWRNPNSEAVIIDASSVCLKVHSLLDWEPDRSPVCSVFILSLKGGLSKSSFDRLAAQFVKKGMLQNSDGRKLVIVPAPSRTQSFDHALALAESLAAVFAAKAVNCLKTTAIESQKTKGKGARSLLVMESCEKFSQFDGKVIFVDDVVTTGSTAKAAYIALGRPSNFEVWSIAYRHLAAD